MKGELLSLETVEKLARIDKVKERIKELLFIAYSEEVNYIELVYFEEILRILEVVNEN